ncbi:MAG TPA: hypothetical protein VLH08_04035, partial [Acidobacteriota bacterium]|nr:hypothetical protein [Acidobacteriota bacterium]
FMMVPITTNPTFDAGTPQLLFEAKDIGGFDFVQSKGEIYAIKRDPNSGIQTSLHLVTNWLNELQRIAPAKKN